LEKHVFVRRGARQSALIPLQLAGYLLVAAVLVGWWYRLDFGQVVYHARHRKPESVVKAGDWKRAYSYLNLKHETLFSTPEDQVVYRGSRSGFHGVRLAFFLASLVLLALSFFPPLSIPFSFGEFHWNMAYALFDLCAGVALSLSIRSALGPKRRWRIDLEDESYRPDRYLVLLKAIQKEVRKRTET
jgi:hypothetical protein